MEILTKNKKTVLGSVVLAFVIAAFLVAGQISANAESYDSGVCLVDTTYKMERPIPTHTSYTFEAEIYIDTADDERAYAIVSNYAKSGMDGNEWAVELHKYGTVRLFHETYGSVYFNGDTNNGGVTVNATSDSPLATTSGGVCDVRTYMQNDEFAKISVTVDSDSGVAKLYVNGMLVKTIDNDDANATSVLKGRVYTQSSSYPQSFVGGDNERENYFRGKIKNVTMYNTVRTEEEIANNYADYTDEGVLFAYDLTNAQNGTLVDLSKNSIDAHGENSEYRGGRTFTASDTLYVQKAFEFMPKTYEAFLYVPNVTRPGTILGNAGITPSINFEINGSSGYERRPALYISDEYGRIMSTKFSYNFEPDSWAHLVITYDPTPSLTTFSCYVNGEKVASFTKSITYEFDIEALTANSFLKVGGNLVSSNPYYYQGNIKNIALYSEVLTESEIKDLYRNGIDKERDDLILYYDLTKAENQTGTTIPDESGNGYDVGEENANRFNNSFSERENSIGDYDYSFAVVGDTQYLVYEDAFNGTNYTSYIYDWLVDNKNSKNIKLVIGLGDVTNRNNDEEWILAVNEIGKLQNADMPFTLIQGNHDSIEKLDKFFIEENTFANFDDIIYYGDKKTLGNYYKFITLGSEKYMIFGLQYGAPDSVLEWAGAEIEKNKDCKVIISTHAYLNDDGTTYDAADGQSPSEQNSTFNDGDMIWDEFLSQHENIVMLFSGHVPAADIVMRQDAGVNGNIVSQFLIDFQGMDASYLCESGMIAMFYVSKSGTVKVEYVSAYNTAKAKEGNPNANDVLFKENVNSFSFDMNSMPEEMYTDYGMIPYEYRSTELYPFAIFDGNGNFITAYEYWLGNGNGPLDYLAYTYMTDNSYNSSTGKFTNNGTEAKSAVILLRRDYAMTVADIKSNNVGHIPGSVIIDLGGHTLSQGASSTYLFMLSAKSKSNAVGEKTFPTTLNVINGTVLGSTKPILYTHVTDTIKDGSIANKLFTVNFAEVTFGLESSSNIMNYMMGHGYYNASGTAPISADAPFVINYNNCVFDFEALPNSNAMCLFNNTPGNNYAKVTMNVNGGIIKPGAYGKFDYVNVSSANGSSVSFTDTKIAINSDYLIPMDYADVEAYPIVVFEKTNSGYTFIGGYSELGLATAGITGYTGAYNKHFVVVLRDDANADTYSNINNLTGSYTIDLNGHTLTLKTYYIFYITRNVAESSDRALCSIKNGKIEKAYANGAIAGLNYGIKSKTSFAVPFVFENVTFTSTSSSSKYGIFRSHESNYSGVAGADFTLNVTAEFNNCTFDYKNSKSEIKMLDMTSNDGGDRIVYNITVNGGVITAKDGFSYADLIVADTNTIGRVDTVRFGKGTDGLYTKLILNSGATAPSPNEIYTNEKGVNYVFVKVAETDNEEIYRLRPLATVNVEFTPKTSITLSNALVYNVYVPAIAELKEFTLDGVTYTDLTALAENIVTLSDGKQYYLFEIELPSAEAARDIVLKATVTVDGKDYSGTFTMSIPKYAAKVIEEGTEVEKTLAKDVLAYVKSAYNYFADYNTAEEIARVNALIDSIIGDYTAAPTISGTVAKDNSGIVTDVTLNLDAKPTIRFYVTDMNVEFKIGNRVLETVKDADGKYVELDVYAYALAETITFGDGGSYHISDFVNGAKGTDYETLVNAFVKYVESAADYRKSVINK